MKLLSARVTGNPYGADGQFAESIALLPPGLRAMAATHWLDISLLDSITWHFGNFGEPRLVAHTEMGTSRIGFARTRAMLCGSQRTDAPALGSPDRSGWQP